MHDISNSYVADGPIQNQTFIFNLSKGWRFLREDSFTKDVECYARRSRTKPG